MISARPPQPRPLTSISPTQFAILSTCVCQAAFARDPSFADLGRSSPAAAMGTAAHAVIEAAYRGEFGGTDDPKRAALSAWDAMIGELADRVAGSREPVRWRDYQIKRLRAATRAAAIATAAPLSERAEYAVPSIRIEGWLRSADGRIAGRPDRIERPGGG